MESLKELYRVGPGPSSSHTLAIKRICQYYLERFGKDAPYDVTLYGSLALTGKGHMTDKIVLETLGENNTNIRFSTVWDEHPNTIKIVSAHHELTFFSVGGGAFTIKGEPSIVDRYVYPENSMTQIEQYCADHNMNLYQYVETREPGIHEYLRGILKTMFKTVEAGIDKEGILPGKLQLPRVAKTLYRQALDERDPKIKKDLMITAFAYACSEENASGGIVTTAPTLGSCGVLPSVLYYFRYIEGISEKKLTEALAVGGLYGNVIKTNATISGAEGGCQAEIGTACAMAAAAISWVRKLPIHQISYAAEIAIEHNLGLTCDPVGGYVMIPCIERNGVAALRAFDASLFADHLGRIRPNRVSFDQVVQTMKYTGKKIARELRETSLGGLAGEIKI